jgi:nucleotide sugar dehydrogenase
VHEHRLSLNVVAGRLRAYTPQELSEAARAALHTFDVGVIAVPTPLRDELPDLTYVEEAARTLGQYLSPGALVVLESTTYPGTTEGLVADALFAESGLRAGLDYQLGFSPERIDPGNGVWTFETTPKLVSGVDPASLARVGAFYDTMVDRTVPVSNPRTAEFTKLFENIFAQVNIALVNELATIAHELDIDMWEVVEAADTKPHGFLKHTPGPGVGGHCLPVDPLYLTWLTKEKLGRPFRFSELAQEINDSMPSYVVDRACEIVGSLEGQSVLVVGVAYKPGVDDIREAPSLDIIGLLEAAGAKVTVTDPHITSWDRTPTLSLESVVPAVENFSLVIIVTDHEEFDYDKIAKASRRVLDTKHRLPVYPNVWRL